MATEYSVEQLLALDKAGIVEYIKANCDAERVLNITNIKDWDEVSESQRTDFVQILM